MRIGGATPEEGRIAGALRDDTHVVEWNLAYEPGTEPHDYFRPPLRTLAERRNSVTIPAPRSRFSGAVVVNGASFEIASGIGHQAHHWGVAQARRWDWAHCCAFEEDPSAVVELLSAPTPLGLPATFVNLHSDRETIRCDGLVDAFCNSARSGLGFWRFEGTSGHRRIVADLRVDPEAVHGFEYTSTDYRRSECWNTQVADCLVRLYERSSSRTALVRTLRSRGRAAAEVHDTDLDRIPYRAWRRDRC